MSQFWSCSLWWYGFWDLYCPIGKQFLLNIFNYHLILDIFEWGYSTQKPENRWLLRCFTGNPFKYTVILFRNLQRTFTYFRCSINTRTLAWIVWTDESSWLTRKHTKTTLAQDFLVGNSTSCCFKGQYREKSSSYSWEAAFGIYLTFFQYTESLNVVYSFKLYYIGKLSW